MGTVINMYLDDSWQMGHTYQEAKYYTTIIYNLMVNCGFLPHPDESVLEPTQIIDTLGFTLNSITMTIYLSPTKNSTHHGTLSFTLLAMMGNY